MSNNDNEIGSQITAIINGALDALMKVGASHRVALTLLIIQCVYRFGGDDIEEVEKLRAHINRELTSSIIANIPDSPEEEARFAAMLKAKNGWVDA